MKELKPCRCGSERRYAYRYRVGCVYHCKIGCLSYECDVCVSGRGLTAKQAEKRARRAWDRSDDNG